MLVQSPTMYMQAPQQILLMPRPVSPPPGFEPFKSLARTVLLARCAALKEILRMRIEPRSRVVLVPLLLDSLALKKRCPPRQNSRVERLKAKVEPLLN